MVMCVSKGYGMNKVVMVHYTTIGNEVSRVSGARTGDTGDCFEKGWHK